MNDSSIDTCLFPEGSLVRHRKGTEYRVEATPLTCRIEAGAVPAYAYRECRPGARLWVRPQAEMEDGRFVLVRKGAVDSAVAAIKFAVDRDTDSPVEFLRCWAEGEFDVIRREWPEAPDEVFEGAEVLGEAAAVRASGSVRNNGPRGRKGEK